MADFTQKILDAVAKKNYEPLKSKALARKLSVPASQYNEFRRALGGLLNKGQVERGKNHTIRKTQPHGTLVGIYRRTGSGLGFVRPHLVDSKAGPEILIRENNALDAVTGDEVVVRLIRKPQFGDAKPVGIIMEVVERASRQFVGVYFERDEQGYVRVDGTVFSHSLYVGDPGAKGANPEDKVVIEILRFPSAEDRGEGVITEVLGPRGQPGVDTLSIMREFGLPDHFPDDVLAEAREAATAFDESDLDGREDFTGDTVITIDPADARDFDDAVSLTQDSRSKHWHLTVHIADVAHFAPPGSLLDREARRRGTSVYLPQRVVPMFPEVISNSVASLQQGRVRFVQTAQIDFTPAGQRTATRFAAGAIKVKRRFTYEQVLAILEKPDQDAKHIEPEILVLLRRMHDLAMILRKRRLKRGAIELSMPETELEFDDQGRVSGAHTSAHDVSHQIIEEFMLAANEAVAEKLAELRVPFLRRIHPPPDPLKLEAFAEFARSLGYKIGKNLDRFTLQRIMDESADKPEAYAMHYGLLRSLKQAVYSPLEEGHYALASETYCHFTSPIRRYPDLTVHRLLTRWLRTGKAGSDEAELAALGEHCSKTERRAEIAERELIKIKLLDYMSQRAGTDLQIIITGVAEYGFFGQATDLPIEGLVHVSTLTDDFYYYEQTTHSLIGRRTQKRYRLGDKVLVKVVRVDLQHRQLDFRVEGRKSEPEKESRHRKDGSERKRRRAR